jgi:hypothetical protein
MLLETSHWVIRLKFLPTADYRESVETLWKFLEE